MRKFAGFKARFMKSTIALSLVLSLHVGMGHEISSVLAEGPTDPAPYIQAKVVNENAGKKILFDNTHGQTAGAADWVIDGAFSDFGNALANEGYDVKELRKTTPITYNDLKDYDVFVIAEANIPFKQSEQAAMEQYVNNGNSIFFIGDHYNADRNKNRWDGSESMNGYRRGAWTDPAQGMSTEERNSEAMQDVVNSDWLGSKFGVRFRYNALGDITANHIVTPDQAFGITEGVSTVAMHAGSTLAIIDPTKAKGIVYLPNTNAAWGNAVDQGVYNGGGIAEGPYVAISKVGAGKAAFIGDSSPVEDATPKYLREETGTKKTTYDGFKEQDDGILLVNMINWLSEEESYASLEQVSNLQLDQATVLLPMEAPETSTEPQAEPWSAPAAGYKWWDRSTFKAGSYGGQTTSANATYSFVHQAALPNAQNFQIRVVADHLPANSTVTGFGAGIYVTGGTQVAKVQNEDGTWPSSYGYSTTFSLTSNSMGKAYKDLTIQLKPGTSGSANLRLRQNGNNLITSAVQIANVPAEPLPEEGDSIPDQTTVSEARSKEVGTVVSIEGVITTEPGAFGGQAFYLQDETAGIYVYQNLSGFHQGDMVRITAPLTVFNTELELTDPISIEKTGIAPLPVPEVVSNVNDTNQGQLVELQDVTIRNVITATPMGSFEFDAVKGAVSTHVRVDTRTGMTLADFPYQEGEVINVQGVSAIFKDVYQLKPRGLGDFASSAEPVLPVTTASVSSSPNANDWYNNDVILTFLASGKPNEIISTKYSMDDGEEVLYTAPLTIQTEGIHTIQYYSSSSTGIAEPARSIQVNVDKTVPLVNVTQSGQAVSNVKLGEVLKFDLHSTDSLSGVSMQKLLLDGKEINSGELVNSEDLGVGVHTIQYIVLDLAGNQAEDSIHFTVNQSLATGVPGKPFLSDNSGHLTGLKGGSYTITMNLWWGNNGTEFNLYENGVLINTQSLSDASPGAQTVKTDITGKTNGIYTYTAELINENGTATSNQLNVTVSNASPDKAVLSHDNWDGDGNYKLTMNLWWGTNGSEYRLYENDILVDTKNLQENTPVAQYAMTELSSRAPGKYEYRSELINASGTTSSEVITIHVVK